MAVPSIRRRILWLSLLAVTLAWFASAAFTYREARHEFNEMLDAHLAQSASLLLTQSSHELEEIETEHTPLLHPYARYMTFQVWAQGRELLLHSANAPPSLLSDRLEGYSDRTLNDERWRVFSAWDDSGFLLVQVAERANVREALARHLAGNLLLPLLLTLPLLALLLWLAVRRGLLPLHRLAAGIAQQRADQLQPLAIDQAPVEVQPLIQRLNGLFGRIDDLLANERRFTANAAHELRTPLAAIQAQLQVAAGARQEGERRHALDGALAGCERAGHLIEQMLTLARLENIESTARVQVSLRELTTRALAELAPSALDRGVEFELVPGDDVRMEGLPALLGVMLRNLLDNAARHTPPGTKVEVSIEGGAAGHSLIVSDDGPGLPAEALAQLGEAFFRPAGTPGSGSGLGLSIVRRIAGLHGGNVRIGPGAGGRGLTVRVEFEAATGAGKGGGA